MMLSLVSWFVPGFQVASLLSGIGLAIIIAIVHAIAVSLFGKDRPRHERRPFDMH
jgi:hypothetical protein